MAASAHCGRSSPQCTLPDTRPLEELQSAELVISDQNTSIIATYTDQAGADLLAKFITASGIHSYVTTSAPPGLAAFHVSVPSHSVEKAMRLLDLTQVAEHDDPTSSEVVAGRLISENVPCCLGGRATLDRFGFVGGYSGPYTICVPRTFLSEAKRVLNEPPVSDRELTELALRTAPEADPPT